MDIKEILKEATGGALNDEVLSEISNVFESKVNDRVELHVENALNEQDELYTEKLKELVEKIDVDHSAKLERVVEAIDKDRAEKLKIVIEKYEGAINEDASAFQTSLVDNISDYLDVYLEEKIPQESVQEAVKNTKARKILEGIRNHLAVDSALEKESVRTAVIDGKKQINEASGKLESITKENVVLKEELDSIKANLIIEQKTATLDQRASKYIKKVMKGKSSEFINENFDYTIKLFKKKESDRLSTLKEEALSTRENVDRVIYEDTTPQQELVSESNTPYLDELSKY
jgi:hypothetical protein|tara:strand:- start:124 stop:990 length:867 start_codon:yes stop_codon:yes gene_type:complete